MRPRRTLLLVIGMLLVAALACNVPGRGGEAELTATPLPILPIVSIIAPADGASVSEGQQVDIRSVSSDTAGGVTRVELRVDGVVLNSVEPSEGPQIAWTVQQSWTPQVSGTHTIQVVAYRGTVASEPASIALSVRDDLALTPTWFVPGGGECTATTTASLNFRTGPGTNYSRIYVLQEGATVSIVGRLGDNSWWQVRSTDGLIGWVAAHYTDPGGNCSGVPVAQPPPSPTPPPTATLTSTPEPGITPTATFTPVPVANLHVLNIEGPAEVVLPDEGGVAVTFVVTLRNAGSGPAGQFQVTFWSQGRAGSAPPETVAVAPLNAGAAVTVTFGGVYDTPGTYVAEAEIDSARQVDESDEGDNIRTFPIQVFPADHL